MRKVEIDQNNIIKKYDEGIESNIYLYKDNSLYNNEVLFKKFKTKEERLKERLEYYKYKGFLYELGFNSKTIDMSPYYLENKYRKLIIISHLKCLKNEIKLLDLAYENNSFDGYTMKKSKFETTNCFEKKKNIIKYLKLLKDKIELLNSNGVFIGDFNEKNFLVSSDFEQLKLCDLDNFKINNIDFDTKTKYMKDFEENCDNKDYIDSYCFNVFTICILGRYSRINVEGNHYKLPYIINTKENREILESMKNLDNTYTPKYMIDNLR